MSASRAPVALALGCILFFITAALGGYKGVATTDAIQGGIIMIGLTAGVIAFAAKPAAWAPSRRRQVPRR